MENIDLRVVLVVGPLAVAAGWALFNIGSAALEQVQRFLNERD